ncbi:MAG: YggS family pyridoxal phosphate-dependent enzyme, partial [Anaerolineales bacterium]
MDTTIASRYEQVKETIARTAQTAGRAESEVGLVVVTKGHPLTAIETVYELGVRDVGENRLEEASFKQHTLTALTGLNWHMIGHIQSRKARDVCGRFVLVHSVDRLKLARKLDQSAQAQGIVQPVLLEFNVSGEVQKSGWMADDKVEWPELLPDVEAVLACKGLEVRGLMTMAPYSTNPEDARPSFVRLRKLRD